MIILQCIKEKSKLRIKFKCYIDSEGKIFNNVYNNNYNCQFPKDIRKEGIFYSIGDNDLALIYDNKSNKAPFYKVNKKNIIVLTEIESAIYKASNDNINLSEVKIFEIPECVICLSELSKKIFIPCGHICCCAECWNTIDQNSKKQYIKYSQCPLCRTEIKFTIEE